MKLDTKTIIKVLPFEEEFRVNLLARLDVLTPDQKYSMEQIVWGLYDALFEMKLQENIRLAMLDVEQKEIQIGPDFYKELRQKTEKEIHSQQMSSLERIDLDTARDSLAKIISNDNPTSN